MAKSVPSPTTPAVNPRNGRAVCQSLPPTHRSPSLTDSIGPGMRPPPAAAGTPHGHHPVVQQPGVAFLREPHARRRGAGATRLDPVMARGPRPKIRADPDPVLSPDGLHLVRDFRAFLPDDERARRRRRHQAHQLVSAFPGRGVLQRRLLARRPEGRDRQDEQDHDATHAHSMLRYSNTSETSSRLVVPRKCNRDDAKSAKEDAKENEEFRVQGSGDGFGERIQGAAPHSERP